MVSVLPRKKSACACALPDCVAPSVSDANTAAATAMRRITATSVLSSRHPAPHSRRGKLHRFHGCMRRKRIVNVQCERLARAVGFEPTIPDLETGALGQAKLRPLCDGVCENWSLET